MDVDDIVIGSGLSALGAVLGLARSRSVLVIGGPAAGHFLHYDARATVPSAYLGHGGLGNDWHGVIPTGWNAKFGDAGEDEFASLFGRFYPRTDPRPRLGQPWLFVPWRPIRPRAEFARLKRERGDQLSFSNELVHDFRADASGVAVRTPHASHRGRRLWLAAGALHTPALLDQSLGKGYSRGTISDHVSCYVGQADGLAAPRIARGREGAFFQAWHSADALYTLRPARFGFRTMDYGIEQRAVFGLPTGSAIAKISRRMSPGLLAEAFYNRFGLFPAAQRHSIYAQIVVRDAYVVEGTKLRADPQAIRSATEAARAVPPFPGTRLSRRPELILPGIHLHHSVDADALARAGVGTSDCPVHVIDASTLRDIGPEHHSFKMMLAARRRAASLLAQE